MPVCKKCKIEKDVSAFAPEPRVKSGHAASCKECYNSVRKTSYNTNPIIKKAKAKYREEHREQNVEYQREYYEKNNEILAQKRKEKAAAKKIGSEE